MSEITIIGGAYTTHPSQYERLMQTAAKVGAPRPALFGIGELHPGDSGVIDRVIAELQQVSTPYVIGTDTYDTMFCRWDEQEIISRVNTLAPRNVLYSCEGNCWPDGPYCAAYKHDGIWKYANGGQAAGKRDALIGLLIATKLYVETGNYQQRLHLAYANLPTKFGLDVHCNIFQAMSNPSPGVEWQDGVGAVNTIEGTRPMMLHFNGRTPGIEVWYDKVMGR